MYSKVRIVVYDANGEKYTGAFEPCNEERHTTLVEKLSKVGDKPIAIKDAYTGLVSIIYRPVVATLEEVPQ